MKGPPVRIARPSRLDHCDPRSDLSNSQFRGLARLALTTGGLWLVFTPLHTRYEKGYWFEPQLAHDAFSDTGALMLFWAQCIAWAFTPYVLYLLRQRGLMSRNQMRIGLSLSVIVQGVVTWSWITVRQWAVFPKVFVLTVSLIHGMKMHSFISSVLTIESDVAADHHRELVQKLAVSETSVGSASTTESTSVPRMEEEYSGEEKSAAPATDGSPTPPPPTEHLGIEMPPRYKFLPKIKLSYYAKFLFVPCLVFEQSYPPMPHPFRPTYFIHKLWDLVSVLAGIYLVAANMVIPVVTDSPNHSIVFTVAKTIVPFVIMDLLFFYLMFECILNLLGELTNFGDREFYEDWWNSTNWDEFSRKWNRPVHEYLLQHVYMKIYLLSKKRSKLLASILTFGFSAVLHECFLSATLGFMKSWLFTIMLCQIPLMLIGRFHRGTSFGNYYFWFGIVMGVPTLVMLYGREWSVRQPVTTR